MRCQVAWASTWPQGDRIGLNLNSSTGRGWFRRVALTFRNSMRKGEDAGFVGDPNLRSQFR